METELKQAIKEVHDKTDASILEVKELHTQVAKLEVNQKTIYHVIDETKSELRLIKDNQLEMSNGILSIRNTLRGNGIKGVCDIIEDNANSIKDAISMITKMGTNSTANKEKLDLVEPMHDFIEGFKGVLKVGKWLVPGTAIFGILVAFLIPIIKKALGW